MRVSLKRIRKIADDIKRDKDWVNDSHTYHEYKGMCYGIDRIINHLEEIDEYNTNKLKKQTIK